MKKEDKITDIVLLLIVLVIFSYTSAKAYLISFTWDESHSYLEYVRKDFWLFNGYNTMSANNHLLNTWLMKICLLFGIHLEFVLRLPNLLAHLLFLLFSAKLVRNLSSPILIVCGYLILNLNPFVLDFFSIARGYGLAMGLMMVSIYYSYFFITTNNSLTAAFLSVLFSGFAVLASSIMLNYFIILPFLFFLAIIIRAKKILFKELLIIPSPLLLLIFLLPIINNEKMAGALFYGGKIGFWWDTAYSLITESVYEHPSLMHLRNGIQIFVIIIFVVTFVIIIKDLRRNKKLMPYSFLLFVLMTIYLCYLANLIQHLAMDIPFPLQRTAIYYIVLFCVMLLFLFDELVNNYGRIPKIIFLALTVFFLMNFPMNANLKSVLQWNDEADTKNMINYLIENKKEMPLEKNTLNVGMTLPFMTDFDFYRNFYHLTWLNCNSKYQMFHPLNDFYYIKTNEMKSLPNIKYKVLKEFPETNSVLISNEEKWKTKLIYYNKLTFEKNDSSAHSNRISTEFSFNGNFSTFSSPTSEFSDGITYSVNDSLLKNKNSMVIVKAMVYVETLKADANLVLSFEDKNTSYYYQPLSILDYLVKAKEWTPVYLQCIVPGEIKMNDIIKCYFWNVGKYPVYIDDMEFRIVAYEK